MRKIIKKFYEPVRKYKSTYITYMVLNSLWTLLMFSVGFFGKGIIDALVVKDYNDMLFWVSCLGAAYLMRNVSSVYFSRTRSLLSRKLNRDIISSSIKKYLQGDNNKAEQIGPSRIQSIIKLGTGGRTDILSTVSNMGLDFVWNLVLGLGILFYYSWELGVLFLCIFLIIIILSKVSEKRSKNARKEIKELKTETDRQVAKDAGSKFEILLQNQVLKEEDRIKGLRNKQITLFLSVFNLRLLYTRLPSILMDSIEICVYLLFGLQVINGSITLGDLTFIIMTLSRSKNYFKTFGDINQQLSENVFHVSKLRDTFEELNEIKNYESGKFFTIKDGSITIRDLNFSYPNGSGIFQDFNLQIRGNTKTALVGGSGSGKSTLIKLISGYIKPDKGDVIVDNQNLKEISLRSYYNHIGYLTQEPSIFDGTIRENLEYGISNSTIYPQSSISYPQVPTSFSFREGEYHKSSTPSPSLNEGGIRGSESKLRKEGIGSEDKKTNTARGDEDNLSKIIQLSQCQFIYDLPQGLDTEIGEKGIRLSGGQRQRLAIAKIMVKDPEIILLDEPTSALDSFAEEEVTKAMNNLFKGRTVIIIAHRLQTVKYADEIIVLGQTKKSEEIGDQSTQILERGSHDELVLKGGYYAKMLDLQSGF